MTVNGTQGAGSFAGARRSERTESTPLYTVSNPFTASSYAAAPGQETPAVTTNTTTMPRWRYAPPLLIAQAPTAGTNAATTTTATTAATTPAADGAGGIPERSEVPEALKWNLADIYPTRQAWEKAYTATQRAIGKLAALKETATSSPAALFAALEEIFAVKKEFFRVHSYAENTANENQGDSARQALQARAKKLESDFNAATAFLSPAILALGQQKVQAYLVSDVRLKKYEYLLNDILRQAKHTLPLEQEAMLARLSQLSESAGRIYETFAYADMPHPTITLSDGSRIEASTTMYARHRDSDNRADRILLFQAFWNKYKKFENTFATMLASHVDAQVEIAKLRHYGSTREAALAKDNVDPKAYDAMLAGIHEGLPTLHRYLKLQQRLLGVEQLAYHDLYAPILPGADLDYTIPEGRALITKALKPLGSEYLQTFDRAFDERWIDLMPNKGKYTGAYMSGDVYDVHPYLLTNWNGNFESVATLAHEFGHAMHSWYTNRTQPFAYADYSIFVAEVPSTTNEILLSRAAIESAPDRTTKIALLGELLNGIRQTVFRQAQFAEFENRIHEEAWKGTPLTAKMLNATYGKVLKEYYGHDAGVTEIDDLYTREWAYIPHFYSSFYVYKYTTSFVAAMAFAKKIMDGEPQAHERFIEMLKKGGSDAPVNILRDAGVDMTTTEPYRACVAEMNRIMDEIETLLAEEETEKIQEMQKRGE